MHEEVHEGDNDNNGPKQHEMRRLGPRYIFLISSCFELLNTN